MNFPTKTASGGGDFSCNFPSSSSTDNMMKMMLNTMNTTMNPFDIRRTTTTAAQANQHQEQLQGQQGGSSSSIMMRSRNNSFEDLMKILDSAEEITSSSLLLESNKRNKKRKLLLDSDVVAAAFNNNSINSINNSNNDIDNDPLWLEPTPLGPQGIQAPQGNCNISPRGLLPNKQEQDELLDMLNPLLFSLNQGQEEEYESNKKRRRLDSITPSPPPSSPNALYPPVTTSLSSSSSSSMMNNNNDDDTERFRPYQFDQWNIKYQELCDYKAKYGNCLVPHSFPPNQQLAQWIKRQRYQFRLKTLGRHSTLTPKRLELLTKIGFIWHSHNLSWMEKYEDLKKYKLQNGHCCVPSNYDDRALAIWVKGQRRQYKLWIQSNNNEQEHEQDSNKKNFNFNKSSKKRKTSTMTQSRFEQLESIGFDWNPRNL